MNDRRVVAPIGRLARALVRRPRVEDLFRHNEGPLVHKVPHFFDIYERHFRRFQGTSPTVLEIGVFHGGSLRMWKQYFGPAATIVGLDIEPRSAMLDDPPTIHVRVGDQSSPADLQALIDEFGPFDIVLDDGSHLPRHQIASLEHLWPALKVGGVYVVEDLFTNYWPEYEGGPGTWTFMDVTKSFVDEIHAFNSRSDALEPSHWTHELTGMHVYDGLVVLDRGEHRPFETVMSGRPTFPGAENMPVDTDLSDEHRAQIAAMDARQARRAAIADRLPPVVVRSISAVRRRLRV